MTFYNVHYRDGHVQFVSYVGMAQGDERWRQVRKMARDSSGNRSGAEKIVRKLTGETVWKTSIHRQPHQKATA